MLQNFSPIYQIALELERLRGKSEDQKNHPTWSKVLPFGDVEFLALLKTVEQECLNCGFEHTADLVKRVSNRPSPETHAEMFSALNHIDDSLRSELERESVFRIPPDRKGCFEQDMLFGPKVAAAFPSCERDIQRAGSCYALGQEDACVHHLMLVVERGLTTLAARVNVTYHYADWQKIIDGVTTKLKSGTLPRGLELDFYRQAHAEFGFLKEAYRKHSAHARDDPYDMPKALSILNHVRDFMQALEKGGLSE